ncbi:tetratricopeptide repeat protein [Hymenobacter sp. B81]|uniref:tetratricopeptide repeat protein n=1 Tax=Hymenobacter sp. B81 TaxID=3344878 RepID=UPI0037DDBC7F
MLHRYCSATLALGLLATLAQAQPSAPAPSKSTTAATRPEAPLLGREALRSAVELHDQGNYSAAIAQYLRVPASDSAYAQIQAELALSYWSNKQHAEAVAAAQRAIDLGMASPMPYVALANAQEDLGQIDQSLLTFQAGLKRYPRYPMLWFNQGITQSNQKGQTVAAVNSFQRSLELYPGHPGSQFQLARVELHQGHLSHALLGMLMYLLISPDEPGSQEVLVVAEQTAANSLRLDADTKRPATSPNEPFAELDQLLGAGVALRADYRSKVKFPAAIVKQTQLLVEKFPVDAKSTDFWQRAYGPVIEELRRNDHLTAFTYLILSSADDKQAAKWVKSNAAKVKQMQDAVYPKLMALRDFQTVVRNGKPERVEAWFYDSGRISGLGDARRDATGRAFYEGPWQLFDEDGNLTAEGRHQNNEPVGPWRYYHSAGGLLREVSYNEQGKREGAFREYHANGQLSIEATYRNGEPVGKARLFHPCGSLREERTYSEAGEMEGAFVKYYPNGQVESRGSYQRSQNHGPQTDFYSDGTPEAEANMLAGEGQGPLVTYFPGPGKRVALRGALDKGLRHGAFTSYFISGKEQETGTYTRGKRTGPWREYHANGKPHIEQSFDEAGLLHGTYREFDADGVLFNEVSYDHNRVRKYQYFDKSGKVREQGTAGKGDTPVRGLRADGTPNFSGRYRNGLMTGEWTYVYRHGTPSATRRFSDDQLDGVQETFHPNGAVFKRTTYVQGERHGRHEQYAADGVLRQEGWYDHGQQTGPWRDYYADGRLSEEYGFYGGAENGLHRSYTPTGKLWSEMVLAAGVRQRITEYDSTGRVITSVKLTPDATGYVLNFPSGKPRVRFSQTCQQLSGSEWFWPNGKVAATAAMRDDQRDGAYRSYHLNGQLAVEGRYERGQPVGEWKYYTEVGKLRRAGRFEEGQKEGDWTDYHANGQVASVDAYHENQQEGLSRRFDPAGQLIYEKRYAADDIMAWRHVQPNGQPGAWQDLSSQQGTLRSYYANGKPAAEEAYRNGLLDGKNRLYHSNGQLYRETEQREGLTTGPQRTYSAEGKLLEEVHYLHGEQHGRSRYFRPDGTLEREESWRSGEQAGPTVYYDAKGRPTRTDTYWNNYVYDSH